MEQTIATKTNTNANLVKVNDAFKVQVEDMNSTLNDLNATLIASVLQVKNLTNLKNQLTQSVELLQKSNDSLGSDKSELVNQLACSNTQLQKVVAENTDLVSANQKLEKSLESVQSQLNSSSSENASLSQSVKLLTDETQVLSQTLEEAIKVAQTTFINGWIYDPNQGWLFTNSETYPMIFSNRTKTWHFYELGSNPELCSITKVMNGKNGNNTHYQ